MALKAHFKWKPNQVSEWLWAKKSEKCVIPSSVGNGRELLMELWRVRFPAKGGGVWGVLPQKFLDSDAISGAFKLQSFLGSIYPNTHTPTSLKNSLQIYTDLKKGPGS